MSHIFDIETIYMRWSAFWQLALQTVCGVFPGIDR